MAVSCTVSQQDLGLRRCIRKIYFAVEFMLPVAKLYSQLSAYTINNPH